MINNANFISQFRTGGDPCTYKESGELQAEMGKLTHPARPDIDWQRVETLSLALFRQNGVALQTLACYALARTKRQGLTGMAEGLSSLEALRTLDIQYQDLALIYRCEQHLEAAEKVLRQNFQHIRLHKPAKTNSRIYKQWNPPDSEHGRYLSPEWSQWPASAEPGYGAGYSLISLMR